MIQDSTGLIKYSDQGLYCELADTWIDPHKPVNRALITHCLLYTSDAADE